MYEETGRDKDEDDYPVSNLQLPSQSVSDIGDKLEIDQNRLHFEPDVPCCVNSKNRTTFVNVIAFLGSAVIFTVLILCYEGELFDKPFKYFSPFVALSDDGAVFLLGDSLIAFPSVTHGLLSKIESKVPYSLGYTNCGWAGNRIYHIRKRLPPVLNSIKSITDQSRPTSSSLDNINSRVFVILFWDSDCSDVDETSPDIETIQIQYITDVQYVIQSLLNVGAYVAIAGPGVLRYSSKTTMLNTYRELNIDLSLQYQMEYIDVRHAFLNSITAGRQPTYDGEHPNEIGAKILAELFTSSILRWKNKRQKLFPSSNHSSH